MLCIHGQVCRIEVCIGGGVGRGFWAQEIHLKHVLRCESIWLIYKYLSVPRTRIGEGNGTPLQNSCLENPMGRGAWWAAVHGVAQSRTWLSDFTFTFHVHALEKEMATQSSVLAWRISGTREPGGLPSMGSHRVRHDWSDLAAAAAAELECKGKWPGGYDEVNKGWL